MLETQSLSDTSNANKPIPLYSDSSGREEDVKVETSLGRKTRMNWVVVHDRSELGAIYGDHNSSSSCITRITESKWFMNQNQNREKIYIRHDIIKRW
jgi:hypothetical protein